VFTRFRDDGPHAARGRRHRAALEWVGRPHRTPSPLPHLSDERPRVEVDDHPRPSFLGEVFELFDPFGVPTLPQVFNRNERPSLGPYCGTLD
jgi:hypothetical protein